MSTSVCLVLWNPDEEALHMNCKKKCIKLTIVLLSQMLVTKHLPVLGAIEDNAGLSCDPDIEANIQECLTTFLRCGQYTKEAYKLCLEHTEVINDQIRLKLFLGSLETHLSINRVLTFDFEGKHEIQAPPVLVLQVLGSPSVIICLDVIKRQIEGDEKKKVETLRNAMRPLVQAVFGGKYIVIGSDIVQDSRVLKKYFGLLEDYANDQANFVDTKWLFGAAKKIGLFHEEVVKFLTSPRVQEGLGQVALCTNAYNHKPFSIEGMTKYIGLDPNSKKDKKIGKEEWKKLHHHMQIVEGGAPIYRWEKSPLSQRQKLYAHLDVVTPLRLLLQYALKVAELEHLTTRHDQLSDLLDNALRFAAKTSLSKDATYKGLEPPKSNLADDTDDERLVIVEESEQSAPAQGSPHA